MSKIKRYWVNASSTLQRDHAYHGRHVLVDDDAERTWPSTVRAYFATGPVVSAELDYLTLSPGWPHSEDPKERARAAFDRTFARTQEAFGVLAKHQEAT